VNDYFSQLQGLLERLKASTVPQAWAAWVIAALLIVLVSLFLDLSLQGVR
jgi:hypothetical protein